VIYNPTSGGRRRRRLERVLAMLRALGCSISLYETERHGSAEVEARTLDPARWDAVIVAGGDGTINETINGLGDIDLPLGIIPLGTANVLAAELGLPRNLRGVAERVAFGRPALVFPAIANGRRFAMMAGIGFDARVVEGTNLRLKRAVGKAAYVASALAALARHRAGGYEIEIDGARRHAAGLVIAKGHSYGGRFVVAAQARLDEPLLQVALFAGASRGSILRYAAALGANRLASVRDVTILPARAVRVHGSDGERVQLDGDLAAALPLEVSVAARPIAVLR
jgi:diacylglycerol kinase (ATP)